MDVKRKIVATILIGVIVIMAIMIFINKDSWFKNEAKVSFNNGCTETYINGKLITPECTIERMALAAQEKQK